MLGWGTDEKALILVLAHRDAAQRKHIQLAYEEMYNENLIKRLESELTGHFEVLIIVSFSFSYLLRCRHTWFHLIGMLGSSEGCLPLDI